jgi:hypothetical protein
MGVTTIAASIGRADQVFPIFQVNENSVWLSSYVDLPIGRVEYVNELRPVGPPGHYQPYYGACIMGHIVDFALAVRGVSPSEYTDEDAVMAMMMEVGTRESALRGGIKLDLPLTGELESEERVRQAQKEQYGVDPLDVEGMLAISYPRP